MSEPSRHVIRTPDQRLRVFVSSTLQELAEERAAARAAITHLRLAPVMFELGARPHPPQELYRAYLDQSHIFIGIYWQKYGWVAPDMAVSGLEDEYNLSGDKPKLIYIKAPAPEREPRLEVLLGRIKSDASYKYFSTAAELRDLLENDLAMILTESFESTHAEDSTATPQPAAVLNNLPISPTRLVGRQTEVEALHDLLTRDEVDLVTLTGPGGTGKTRLAIQAATDLANHFPDGVFFVALATIREPQLVPIAIATTLNMRESTGGPPMLERVKNYLRDRRVLLLLDNFEQVVAAAPVIFDLLQTCAQLKVLVTSRTPLRLRGEREFPVTPLPVPDRRVGIELDRVSQYAAVQLFIQRALDVKPNFVITNENAPAVAEICYRLDGLPLAIELAAARIKVLTPQAMLARLEHGLPLLSSGMRDLPERQQTLRNTIDWSFNLLDDDAKLLFRSLAVFVGGWTLEAAEAMCACKDDLELDILSTMEVLIDNSLLMRVQPVDGEIRFGMLGTIREYAQEKLSEAGEIYEVQGRHFEYYVQYAERAEQQLKGQQQLIWLRSLETELDNLRAALEWAQANHAAPTAQAVRSAALRLASALHWFWFVRGHWSEGLEWLRRALMMSAGAPPEYQAKTLNATGFLAWYAGDFVMARAQLTGSMSLCREANIQPELAYALAYLANVTMWQDGPVPALKLAQESQATFQSLGDKWGCAYALYTQGLAALWQNDLAAARSLFEQSVKIYREIGDRWRASASQGRLGGLAYRQGDYAKAAAFYVESLTVSRELGDKPGIAVGLSSLADVALAQGDFARAEALYAESLALHVELNDRLNSGWARYGLGKVAWAQGDYERAKSLIEESLSTVQAAGDRSGMAWLYQILGHLTFQSAVSKRSQMPPDQQATYLRQSLVRFREALKLAQELDHIVTVAFCVLGSAGLAAVNGQPELAAQLWGAAIALREAAQASMSAVDRAEYERAIAIVCEYINVDTYPEATAAGRQMTVAEAVTFTLREVHD